MEDKTYGTLVTDCGIQLIAAAVMEGKKINITDLAVGDGGGSYYDRIKGRKVARKSKPRRDQREIPKHD